MTTAREEEHGAYFALNHYAHWQHSRRSVCELHSPVGTRYAVLSVLVADLDDYHSAFDVVDLRHGQGKRVAVNVPFRE